MAKVKAIKPKRVQDPRTALFKANYTDPKSGTFGNATRSAIKAGYSETYADNLCHLMPAWFSDLLEDDGMMRADMLRKAQRNIKAIVDEPKPETKDDKNLWFKASEFVSGTLGRDFYSTRQEVTGADGRRLFTNEKRADATVPLTNLFKGVEQPK